MGTRAQMPQVLEQLDNKHYWTFKKQHLKLKVSMQLLRHRWLVVVQIFMPLHSVLKLPPHRNVWIACKLDTTTYKVAFPAQMVQHMMLAVS